MAKWKDKVKWVKSGTNRYIGYEKDGTQGDHVGAFHYLQHSGKFTSPLTATNGAKLSVDIPNLRCNYDTERAFGSFPSLRNKSWESFVESARGNVASLGVTAAEWRQSLDMVTNRALQCYQGYRDLRKGDFRGFLDTIGVKAKRKHKNTTKNKVNQASSLWLEYSFGWAPLFGDMHNAIDSIGQPLPGGKCHGSARMEYNFREVWTDPGWYVEESGMIATRQGAYITLENPNLYLLQQLGLANPAVVAWELVPFSFVVDWVFDVGTALGGITDLLGLKVEHPYHTAHGKFSSKMVVDFPGWCQGTQSGTSSCTKRTPGLLYPLPNLDVRANIGSSLKRAANAASLLGQILTK